MHNVLRPSAQLSLEGYGTTSEQWTTHVLVSGRPTRPCHSVTHLSRTYGRGICGCWAWLKLGNRPFSTRLVVARWENDPLSRSGRSLLEPGIASVDGATQARGSQMSRLDVELYIESIDKSERRKTFVDVYGFGCLKRTFKTLVCCMMFRSVKFQISVRKQNRHA